MRIVKKVTAIFISVVMMLSIAIINVYAVSTTQDGLEVSLTTDKETYNKKESITALLSVKNTNASLVSNLSLETVVPKGYKADDSSTNKKYKDTILPYETTELKVILVPDSNLDINQESHKNENELVEDTTAMNLSNVAVNTSDS